MEEPRRRQFDPEDVSFVPRAFSLTHINLTHRNWTAVGLPCGGETPIVDPAGLVTPFFDGWSVDAWVVYDRGSERIPDLIPSRSREIAQRMEWPENVEVRTSAQSLSGMSLTGTVRVEEQGGAPACVIDLEASAERAILGTPAAGGTRAASRRVAHEGPPWSPGSPGFHGHPHAPGPRPRPAACPDDVV